MTVASEPMPEIESPLSGLTPEQIEQLGEEFQAIHDEVFASLGERDSTYIRSIIALQRRLALLGRALLFGSRYRPSWIAGTATLSMAKILENMEIGHNVMHGQWDWMNDPYIHSSTWDWDTASTKEAWKHSHNYVHHTYTNIRGKDKDLGYEIMRIDPHQRWHPVYLLQPLYNLVLMAFFEWGVAFHDMDLEAVRKGEKSAAEVRHDLKGIAGKARTQIVKDYVAWPLVSAALSGAVAWLAGPRLEERRGGRTDKVRRRAGRALRRARRKPRAAGRRTLCVPPPRPIAPPPGPTSWRTSCATCGPTRSSSAGTSPTRPTRSARTRWPTRAAAAGTCASSSARPTSRAGRSST